MVICAAGAEAKPPGGNLSFFLNYYQTAMQCAHIYVVPRPAPLISICGTSATPSCGANMQMFIGRMGEEVNSF